jgi:hypothetical protein
LLLAIDRANASPYRKIIDPTGLTSRLPVEALRTFSLKIRRREAEREVGPIAIVAGSPQAHELATRFAEEARGLRLIQVFQRQREARRWLDSFYAHERFHRLSRRES